MGLDRDKEAVLVLDESRGSEQARAVDWGGVKSRRPGDPPDGCKGLCGPLSPSSCLPSSDRYLWTPPFKVVCVDTPETV